MAKKKLNRTLVLAGLLIASSAFLGVLYMDWTGHRARLIAEAVGWKIDGPPCRAVSAEEYARTVDPYAAFANTGLKVDFDDARLSWSSGDSTCHDILLDGSLMLDTYPVCQFRHPRKIKVTTPGGDHYYVTGESPVTISIPRGKVSCVLNANLKHR